MKKSELKSIIFETIEELNEGRPTNTDAKTKKLIIAADKALRTIEDSLSDVEVALQNLSDNQFLDVNKPEDMVNKIYKEARALRIWIDRNKGKKGGD